MFILGLTPDVIMTLHQLDQYADLNIAQRISILPGDGQVDRNGRCCHCNQHNTVEQPVGTLQGTHQAYQIGANSQLLQVDALSKVIVAIAMMRQCASASRPGGRRLRRATAARLVNNHIGEIIGIWRQPSSNTLQLVDRIKAMLPRLEASIPPSVKLIVVSDRSLSISASIADAQLTLCFTVALVVLVIFAFLRSFWATMIPSITIPLSLVGTFAVLYLGGYSIDNLSLMALTLAVGLVVDDAIVMLENIFDIRARPRHTDGSAQGRDGDRLHDRVRSPSR